MVNNTSTIKQIGTSVRFHGGTATGCREALGERQRKAGDRNLPVKARVRQMYEFSALSGEALDCRTNSGFYQ
jgi:hypothetical protein